MKKRWWKGDKDGEPPRKKGQYYLFWYYNLGPEVFWYDPEAYESTGAWRSSHHVTTVMPKFWKEVDQIPEVSEWRRYDK